MSEKLSKEELARRLLEQPSAAWPGELDALRVEVRPMPASLRKRLSELTHESAASTASATGAEPPAKSRILRFRLAAGVSFAGAIAALLLVYFGFIINRSDSPPAAVVFVSGEVLRNEHRAAVGDRLAQKDRLTVAGQSLAVLLSENAGSQVNLRLLSDSEIRLDLLNSDLFKTRLKSGRIYVSLSRNQERAAPSQGLSIYTRNAEASVTGTVFSVETNSSSDTMLSTYEGTVNFRRRWDALEDLPAELIAKSELLSGTLQVFQKASVKVSALSQSTVHGQDFKDRLRRIERLESALADPSLARLRLRQRSDVSRIEIRSALDFLERAFPTAEDRAANLRLVQAAFGQPPEAQTLSAEQMQARRLSFEAADEKEREARYQELRNGDRPVDRETFRREATRVLGKSPQEIQLKNGETIFGVVFGENGRYRVYTANGIVMLDPEQIEEIKFE